jgi:hypothetical protein
VGGGGRLFTDELAAGSWSPAESSLTESGAICLVYDRVRAQA